MKKIVPVLVAALVSLSAGVGTPARAATWQIDSAHTNAQFAVRHLLVSKVRGSLGKVTGSVSIDEANLDASSVEATVDVTAVDTGNTDRDEHLRAAEYLDTEKYPTLTFRSTKVERKGDDRFAVTGDLTLKGVTKEVVLEVEGATKPIKDPWGKMRLGGVIETTLERDAFGVGGQKLLEGGGLAIGNEVEVTIDIELTKAE